MKPTPILFVDLDQTVRYNSKDPKDFISEPADIEIYDGVVDILKSYKQRGWRIVAISNQGGIAMGHVTDNEVNRGMQETNRLCASLFDRMLWCPHHPDADSNEESICFCRKPRIGHVITAIVSLSQQHKDEVYRPYACLFVGDRQEDCDCAANANMPFEWAEAWRARGPLV